MKALALAAATALSLNVKDFGAKGDGIIDDTLAIQAALDRADPRRGVEIYFPPGTYLVSPHGKANMLIVKSHTRLFGDGAGSVIKVADWAGDYHSVFGSDYNWSKAFVENVAFEALKFDQNSAGNSSCDIRSNGADLRVQHIIDFSRFTGVTVRDSIFDPVSGVNTIVLNGPENHRAAIVNNYFRFVHGCSAVAKPYDNSAIYLQAKDQTVAFNTFVSNPSERAFGAIEAHEGPARVYRNRSIGYQTGVNIVAQSLSNDDIVDPLLGNDIIVASNTFLGANHGIRLWPSTGRSLSRVEIRGNRIGVSQLAHETRQAVGINVEYLYNHTYDGLIKDLLIADNEVAFQDDAFGSHPIKEPYGIGIGVDSMGDVSDVLIANNKIHHAPLIGIRVGNQASRKRISRVRVEDNLIVDAGGNTTAEKSFRNSLRFEGPLSQVSAVRNRLVDSGRGKGQGPRGISAVWVDPVCSGDVSLDAPDWSTAVLSGAWPRFLRLEKEFGSGGAVIGVTLVFDSPVSMDEGAIRMQRRGDASREVGVDYVPGTYASLPLIFRGYSTRHHTGKFENLPILTEGAYELLLRPSKIHSDFPGKAVTEDEIALPVEIPSLSTGRSP